MNIASKIVGVSFLDQDLCRQTDRFPTFGTYISQEEKDKCFKEYYNRRLKRNWDCIYKAQIAADILSNETRGELQVHVGSLVVFSVANPNTSYGYFFNPPLEVHAWAFSPKENVLYDLALPGVIIKGLSLRDEYGPYLEGNVPEIIAEEKSKIPLTRYYYNTKERIK